MTKSNFDDMGFEGAPELPVLKIIEGRPMADSRDIAGAFGKEHKNVLTDIDNLLKLLVAEIPAAEIREVWAFNPGANRETRAFLLDRDAFTLLAMGFQGARALKWKLRFLAAFKAMEAELQRRAQGQQEQFTIPKSHAEALRLAADLQEECEALTKRAEAAEEQLEERELWAAC